MKEFIVVVIIAATVCLCALTAGAIDRSLPQYPLAEHNLVLSAPVNRWNGPYNGVIRGPEFSILCDSLCAGVC